MSDLVRETGRLPADPGAPVLARLSILDRFLPVWIGVAMVAGLLLGRAIPGLDSTLSSVEVGSVSLPIAVGLLVMMYPVLAKVRYSEIGMVAADRRMLVSSLVLNWLVGPAVMFALAWLLLPDLPAYRTGLIIVGLARCIAMVLIWNDLACGDREAAAVLVAINSIFQIVAFAGLGYFYLKVLPGWLGLSTSALSVSVWDIARSVLVFLGIPLVAGFLTRTLGERTRGRAWYEETFLPRISPIALYGLLFTVVILFALQGHTITSHPGDVVRIALPLLAYFAVMFGGSFLLGLRLGLPYPRTATLAFTAAGNNFELAIAVAIGVFGVTSGQALAGVVGPLIEVPVLVGLVYVALWARRRFYYPQPAQNLVMTDAAASDLPHLLSHERVLHTIAEELTGRFAGVYSPETVERYVFESYGLLAATAKVPNHLAPLTKKFAADRLVAAAQAQGAFVKDVPEVLFVCVHNAGRSQMAAALLDHYAAGKVHVRSAGSTPGDQVNPAVVEAMAEVGLDLSKEFPKPLTDDVVQAADVVITMGCGDACPVYLGKRYLDWELDDPAGKPLDEIRPIRDEIDRRVQGLVAELVDPAPSPAR